MTKLAAREFGWIANAVVRLAMWVEPAGGQTVARRNAWSSLVQTNRLRAQRLEAEQVANRAALERPAVERPREMAVV